MVDYTVQIKLEPSQKNSNIQKHTKINLKPCLNELTDNILSYDSGVFCVVGLFRSFFFCTISNISVVFQVMCVHIHVRVCVCVKFILHVPVQVYMYVEVGG